jgi:hypothetical protein
MDRLRQSMTTPVGRVGTAVLAVVLVIDVYLLATRPEPLWLFCAASTGLVAGMFLAWSAQYVYERRQWVCGVLAILATPFAAGDIGRAGDVAWLVLLVAATVGCLPPPAERRPG